MKTAVPRKPGSTSRLTQMTRREFARTTLRTVWLGGMVALGAVLARRECHARGSCRGCALLAECALPWRKEKL